MGKPATVAPAYPHLTTDTQGAPLLAGTTMKVIELVMAQQAHGWSPEELHFQFPGLSLGQIHAALSYYWDYKDELDAEIERRSRYAEQARSEARAGRTMPAADTRMRELRQLQEQEAAEIERRYEASLALKPTDVWEMFARAAKALGNG